MDGGAMNVAQQNFNANMENMAFSSVELHGPLESLLNECHTSSGITIAAVGFSNTINNACYSNKRLISSRWTPLFNPGSFSQTLPSELHFIVTLMYVSTTPQLMQPNLQNTPTHDHNHRSRRTGIENA